MLIRPSRLHEMSRSKFFLESVFVFEYLTRLNCLLPWSPDVPTYEYRCPEGHEFEHFFRSMSLSQAMMKCPVCGKDAERKVSGGSGLVFKGSGFYITDYGKDGKKDLRRASDEASKSAGEKGKSLPSGGEQTKPASGSGEGEKKGSGKPPSE